GHEAERLVGQVRRRQPRQDHARARAPQRVTDVASRDVLDPRTRATATRLLAQPGHVVRSERRARDDREHLRGDASNGEVSLNPAAPVQSLRVGDITDTAKYP